jgi:hypothetical protein
MSDFILTVYYQLNKELEILFQYNKEIMTISTNNNKAKMILQLIVLRRYKPFPSNFVIQYLFVSW